LKLFSKSGTDVSKGLERPVYLKGGIGEAEKVIFEE
jgi:hypothetical protein